MMFSNSNKISFPQNHSKSGRKQLFFKIWLLLVTILFYSQNEVFADQPTIKINDSHTFTDQSGQTFTVKAPYQRIISLYGAHTENLYALGAEEKLIGVGRHEIYPPDALKKTAFSYRDDPEKFLAVRPDLVLIRPMISRAYPNLIQRMIQNGITIVSIQPSNMTEMYTYWRILGILTGKNQMATQMVETFQRAVKAYDNLAQSITPKKRVFLEAIHNKMKTFTSDAMAAVVLKLAGGINIADDAPQVRSTNIAYYGIERILSKADKIDVYIAQVGAMNHATIEMITKEPGFHIIKAIKENQIHLIDETIISRPTPRLLRGIYTMGQMIYPTQFNAKRKAILENASPIIKEVSH
ncbi:MAG: ABC transporter substrate-binding protein [Desulfobacteraceae bacterium]|jgi:iron complex transport system substrate-binding protein